MLWAATLAETTTTTAAESGTKSEALEANIVVAVGSHRQLNINLLSTLF